MAVPYTPDLCTLERVLKKQDLTDRDAQALNLRDDYDEVLVLLTDMIHEVSADIADYCDRVFMPYEATKEYDWAEAEHVSLRELALLGDDLISVSSFTYANGSTPSTTTLLPRNEYPKWKIRLGKYDRMVYDSSNELAATVVGTFGYAPRWPNHWLDSGVTLDSSLTAAASTITLASEGDASVFERLQYIQINDETLQITDIDGADLTVVRGELGTTAAAHDAGDPLNVYKQLEDLARATADAVRYRYKTLSDEGGQVAVYASGTVQVQSMDRSITKTIDRYRRTGGYTV